MKNSIKLIFSSFIFIFLSSCEEDKPGTGDNGPVAQKKEVITPSFDEESAYNYIQTQVDFGPRVPNSDAHLACSQYLENTLESFGAEVIVQKTKMKAYDGKVLNVRNVIGQFQPAKKKRILLYAHYDTRPFADKDTIRIREPIDGANDGASGVGVLLEVARNLQKQPTDYGIDIIFFDAEDYGKPEWAPGSGQNDYLTWCLGSQYWSQNKHKAGYRAKFGILLDMVGAKNSVFNKEGTSVNFASGQVNKVWNTAKKLGFSNYFKNEVTGSTIDDNLFVSRDGGIPSVNIVHYQVVTLPMGYGPYHHTHDDNMKVIDKDVLKAVGQTVMEVIYQE